MTITLVKRLLVSPRTLVRVRPTKASDVRCNETTQMLYLFLNL